MVPSAAPSWFPPEFSSEIPPGVSSDISPGIETGISFGIFPQALSVIPQEALLEICFSRKSFIQQFLLGFLQEFFLGFRYYFLNSTRSSFCDFLRIPRGFFFWNSSKDFFRDSLWSCFWYSSGSSFSNSLRCFFFMELLQGSLEAPWFFHGIPWGILAWVPFKILTGLFWRIPNFSSNSEMNSSRNSFCLSWNSLWDALVLLSKYNKLGIITDNRCLC